MDQTALSFFVNAVVSAVAFFVAGHKTMFKHDLAQLDMAFRKCSVVLSVTQLVWIGRGPGTKYCMMRKCECQLFWSKQP